MVQRLQSFYTNEVVPALQKQYSYANLYQVPKLEKIVINRGIGEASTNAKLLESCLDELTTFSGQKGVITKAKKSIAGFKLRQDVPVGVSVTLRGEKMYAFLDRLVHLALPRIRDFQGIPSKSFDGRGNYAIGFPEQLMFPELSYEQVDQMKGMDICICTTAQTDSEARHLLQFLGMPFTKEGAK